MKCLFSFFFSLHPNSHTYLPHVLLIQASIVTTITSTHGATIKTTNHASIVATISTTYDATITTTKYASIFPTFETAYDASFRSTITSTNQTTNQSSQSSTHTTTYSTTHTTTYSATNHTGTSHTTTPPCYTLLIAMNTNPTFSLLFSSLISAQHHW